MTEAHEAIYREVAPFTGTTLAGILGDLAYDVPLNVQRILVTAELEVLQGKSHTGDIVASVRCRAEVRLVLSGGYPERTISDLIPEIVDRRGALLQSGVQRELDLTGGPPVICFTVDSVESLYDDIPEVTYP